MIMKYPRDAVKLALLLPLAGRSAAQMLGPDESSIAGVASPPNYILYEETTTDKILMSQPLRIESDVPVTVQRYDDINYIIGAGPISEQQGDGVILVTSNCDTGATDVVPTVEITTDGNATLVSVKLGVTEGGGSLMPFLKSSSYEAVFYENSYIKYTAADIQPEDPIVEYVPCMTEAECREASQGMSNIKYFFAGEYATSGCFYKNDKAYWSTVGDPAEGAVNGIQQRVWCKEVYYIDDVAVDTGDGGGTCTTQDQCDKTRLELGIKTFVPGTFPTKGCFSKTGVNGLVAYWSEGGTAEEMSSTDLPGVQERIMCDGDGSTPPGGTECESGPMADPAKSCDSGQFCLLDVGVCETKIGVFTGACEIKPEVCIEIYDPVCGCDGTTYGNECVAHGQGVSVSRVGECDGRDSDGGTCATQDQCDQKRLELGIKTFVPGTFPTKGCFSKTGVNGLVAYWSEGGTAEEMSSTDLPGVQERIMCDGDGSTPPGGTECESGPMADPAKSCDSGQFCLLDVGVCETKIGVFTGACEIKPEVCIEIYDPVCGCDGATYGNECVAHGQGVSVSRVGECDVGRDSDGGTCATQDQCDQKRLELGIVTFVPGTFPTKGCFSKSGVYGLVAYWSDGGTAEEMSSTDLPGVQERITCEGDKPTPPVGTECESGPMADPAKTCDSGQFCQLDVGVCNAKNGVFNGACAIKPEVCIQIYDPVCGCDGMTYGNECVAHGQGISVSRDGECDEEVFTASQAVYLSTENSGSAMSSASSMKGFVLGTILNNVVSSQVVKSLKPQSRLLQDTCTYNVEILLSGCYAGTSARIEVAAPKARVINSVMEIVETETVAVYESSAFEDTQFYGKEFKHTVTLTFPDDQEQLIDGAGDAYASVPPLDEGTCIPVMVGRPFIDSDGHSLVASSISAHVCSETSSWLGDTSVLAREGELMDTHASSGVNVTNQHRLGEKWTRNALGEHASVASFAAFSIALMTNHAPSDLVEDSLKAALDEVRHAKMSFAIASKLLGKDVTPGPLPSSKHQFNGDLTALAISVAKEGCVEETLSALAAAADVELIDGVLENGAAVGAKYSGIAKDILVWIRDELRTISMDESNHSALAWRTLDWVCRVDSDACYAAKQRVLDENNLIEAFQRRFGRNLGYSSELSERMMMAWRNIYTGQGVPRILIGSASIDDVVDEVTGYHASNPSFMTLLVDNISSGGSYRT